MLPMMPNVPRCQTHDDVRHGTTNLYAALDIASGQVITEMTPRHRAREFQQFLTLIDRNVPTELAVYLVLDNVATHRTAAIPRWLRHHPRFTFHFTPTYSSWMNLVERWFAELNTKWLRRGTHDSVADLIRAVEAWVADWNRLRLNLHRCLHVLRTPLAEAPSQYDRINARNTSDVESQQPWDVEYTDEFGGGGDSWRASRTQWPPESSY